MRDLKIRGAGNLLGAEQSGHMDNIGYDMYLKYMRESVAELKGKKFKEEKDTTVEIGINAHISSKYVEDAGQKIDIYRRIAMLSNKKEAEELKEELKDRFGSIPKETESLIVISLIKKKAQKMGIESIIERQNGFEIKFFENVSVNVEKLLRDKRMSSVIHILSGKNALLFKTEAKTLRKLIEYLNYLNCIME